jgi:hypothetical protein
MKRLSVCFVALAFAGLSAVGCSKTAEVATPSVPNVPNVDNLEADAAKCTELAASWATVVVPGADGAKVKQQIEDMKAQVPDSVKDDLTVIGDGVSGASDPMALAEFYSSPEFTAANDNVTKYLTVECTKVGS